VVKVLCYKSEGRWFDPSLRRAMKRIGCVAESIVECYEHSSSVVEC